MRWWFPIFCVACGPRFPVEGAHTYAPDDDDVCDEFDLVPTPGATGVEIDTDIRITSRGEARLRQVAIGWDVIRTMSYLDGTSHELQPFDGTLEPDTTYDLQYEACESGWSQFTTRRPGPPVDPASLIGRTWSVDLDSGDRVVTGFHPLMPSEPLLIGVVDATDTTLTLAIASPPGTWCNQLVTADFQDNPWFRADPAGAYSVGLGRDTVDVRSISAEFDSTGLTRLAVTAVITSDLEVVRRLQAEELVDVSLTDCSEPRW